MFIEQAPESTAPAAVPPHRGIEHIGLRVEDIEAAVADLAARGIPLVSGITDVKPGLRIAFFEGPDGVRIEILQRG
jgi:catechol 2,3-dioxygenase-like lactoylglutathione lyase family enzyme